MKRLAAAAMTAVVMLGTVAISSPADAARKSSQTYP